MGCSGSKREDVTPEEAVIENELTFVGMNINELPNELIQKIFEKLDLISKLRAQ